MTTLGIDWCACDEVEVVVATRWKRPKPIDDGHWYAKAAVVRSQIQLNERLLKGEHKVLTIKIKDIFTQSQKRRAVEIWLACEGKERHDRLVDEVVGPAMKLINDITKQQNDANYIAYALENALNGTVNPDSGKTNFCA